jgi:hypothetical protein
MSDDLKPGIYVAICTGDDETGAWLWAYVDGRKMPDLAFPFIGEVINGFWQFKYDWSSRLLEVVKTKQIILGPRLAGIGRVPKSWGDLNDYNAIINEYLRTGRYLDVETFAHDRH